VNDRSPWFAFFLPKATPGPIVNKRHDAGIASMTSPVVAERLHDVGVVLVAPDRHSPGYLGDFVKSEIEKWAVPMKASGISMD
jgi:tripartite-type tricarboxylate transporter receptor subunit TctC